MCSPLITAPELAELIARGDAPTLLDVRWELATGAQRDRYEDGHIPGAAFIDLDRELSAPAGPGGRHPLPASEDFRSAMRAAGVSDAGAVVVYDAANALAAARAWWLLRFYGHSVVRVLDGGFAAWTGAGGRVVTGTDAPTPGDFTGRPGEMPTLNAQSAAALADTGVLLDARAPERFRGDVEPMDPVGGHIPGAHNLPMARLLQDSGQLRDRAGLRQEFEAVGVDGSAPVGTYCGSGITGAHTVLALELAGLEGALYPGSWSDWVTDPARPVATGA